MDCWIALYFVPQTSLTKAHGLFVSFEQKGVRTYIIRSTDANALSTAVKSPESSPNCSRRTRARQVDANSCQRRPDIQVQPDGVALYCLLIVH
jgi:hypothetical protein